MRVTFLTFWLILTLGVFSQDTVSVLQYNLLFYGVNSNFCTPSNNNINQKDEHLKKIINYIKPDIFAVNEISNSQAIQAHLLDQVLNTNGVDYYRKSNFISIAESDLVNMLYYNSEKLTLQSHTIAQSYIRDIDVYKLYYNSDDLASGDTAFIICVVAHLKAGDGVSNENKRKVMAQNTMKYLDNHDDDNNYLMMGDFNLYKGSEDAYQQFIDYTNPSLNFLDPVDQYGNWHNNADFRYYHTQSTVYESNGCKAKGGMDDRFDFILISKSISEGSKFVKYEKNSYWAVGQDGKHFNTSIIASPTNTSVPSDILNALYRNSDHLPVTLNLLVGKSIGVIEQRIEKLYDISIMNPVRNSLQIKAEANFQAQINVQVMSITGSILQQEGFTVNKGMNQLEIQVNDLTSGIYLVRFSDNKGNQVIRKMIKN
jgi:endonuclease/exonuclease/phosphatase family metal-dependent hydrolase